MVKFKHKLLVLKDFGIIIVLAACSSDEDSGKSDDFGYR